MCAYVRACVVSDNVRTFHEMYKPHHTSSWTPDLLTELLLKLLRFALVLQHFALVLKQLQGHHQPLLAPLLPQL